MNKVAVIVPTIGRSSINETLHSILLQGKIVHEILVVNSSHQNLNLLLNDRIKVLVAPKQFNVSNARNVGLQNVDPACDWVAFCDDDDIWLPEKLSIQIDYCLDNHLDGCFTGAFVKKLNGKRHIRPKKEYDAEKSPLNQVYSSFFSRDGYLPFPSFCFKSYFLPLLTFDERFTEHEDLLFVHKLVTLGSKIGQTRIPLVEITQDLSRSLRRFDFRQEYLWFNMLFSIKPRLAIVYVFRIALIKFVVSLALRFYKQLY